MKVDSRLGFGIFLIITLVYLAGFIAINSPTGFDIYKFVNEELTQNVTEAVTDNETLEQAIVIEPSIDGNETIEIGQENITIEDDNITIEEPQNITTEENVTSENITIEQVVDINKTLGIENVTIEVNVTKITNVTESETRIISRVEINKPVKFVKKVKPIGVSEKVRVELPEDAANIEVDRIEDGIKSDVDKSKVKVEGLELEDYNEITGSFVVDANISDNIIVKIINWLRKLFGNITGFAVLEDQNNSTEVIIEEFGEEFEIGYELPGPEAIEEEVNSINKKIIVSSDIHYENILTYTDIIETKEENINLYWLINDSRILVEEVTYTDSNNNGLIDRIEWITPYLSIQTYEISIKILNVQSYPQVGENWTVEFNTTGKADLRITAINGTKWSNENEDYDLKFLQVKCGGNILDYDWIDNGPENSSVLVKDYECDEKGFEISKVLTRGAHTLEFRFGDDVDYAFNLAGDLINISDAYDARIHGRPRKDVPTDDSDFGSSVVIADLNDDGIKDLIVGAKGELGDYNPDGRGNAGRIYVLYGPLNISGTSNITNSPINITFIGINGNDAYGSGLGVGDFNNDSNPDLATGAFNAEETGGNNVGVGEVSIMYGPFANGSNQQIEISSRVNITYRGKLESGGTDSHHIGTMEFSNADLNNDGVEDLIVGAYHANFNYTGDSNVGAVYVLYGPLNGTSGLVQNITEVPPNITYFGKKQDDNMGTGASTGDLNNDSVDDLIIGAYQADPITGGTAGEVYVVYGPLPNVINQTFNVSDVENITFNGESGSCCGVGSQAGDSIGFGDLNDDGNVTDIIIGAPTAPTSGRVYTIYGPFANGSNQQINITNRYNLSYHGVISGASPAQTERFGSGMAVGDINNDSVDDWVIGAEEGNYDQWDNDYEVGLVYIIYGLVGDREGPNVDLQAPANNSVWTEGYNVRFLFNVTDRETGITNCSLYTNQSGNWQLEQSINGSLITEGSNYTITHIPNEGNYLWNIRCYDNSTQSNNAFDTYNWTFKLDLIPRLIENSSWQQDIVGVNGGSLALGDLDGDNDLDLVVSGAGGSGDTRVYINNGTRFNENSTWEGNVTDLRQSALALGDVDNDGDLDLVATGVNVNSVRNARVFINNGTALSENSTWYSDMTGLDDPSIAFGDLNLDGKLDLVFTGQALGGDTARVYINNGTRFNENSTWQQNLTGLDLGSIALGDVDKDGDLDLALTGDDGTGTSISRIYLNNRSSLVENNGWGGNLTQLGIGSIALGDLDSDGDLDLVFTGVNDSTNSLNRCDSVTGRCGEVYFNNGSAFVYNSSFSNNMSFVSESSIALGDLDSDGNLDLALFGRLNSSTLGLAKVATNNLSLFFENRSWYKNLTGIYQSDVAFGDFDNDSKLDLVAIGTDGVTPNVAKVYTSNWTKSNTKPSAPTLFNSTFSGSTLTLSWNQGSDTETSKPGLYYNLRVGTCSGCNDAVSGKYGGSGRPAAGYFGNMMQRTNITLTVSSNQKYFWSVQTIDTGLLSGSFSSEQIITDQPVVDLRSPANDTFIFNNESAQFIFNVTDNDDGIYNCSLYTNETGSWIVEDSNSSVITEGSNYTIVHNMTSGSYLWNVRCYDDSATRNNVFDSVNWTLEFSVFNVTKPVNNDSTTDNSYTIEWGGGLSFAVSCFADLDNSGFDKTQTCFTNATNDGSQSCDISSWSKDTKHYVWCELNDTTRVKDYSVGTITPQQAPSGGGGGGGDGGDEEQPPPPPDDGGDEEQPPPPPEEEPPEEESGIELGSGRREGNSIILDIVDKGNQHNITKINITITDDVPKVQLQLDFGVEDYPVTCYNMALDGDELGVDCGGSCGICLTVETPRDYTCLFLLLVAIALILISSAYRRHYSENKYDVYFRYLETVVYVLFILVILVFSCWLALSVILLYLLYEPLKNFFYRRKPLYRGGIPKFKVSIKDIFSDIFSVYYGTRDFIIRRYSLSLLRELQKEIFRGNYIYVAEELADLRINLNRLGVKKDSSVWFSLLKLEKAVELGFFVDDALAYIKKGDMEHLRGNLRQINEIGYIPNGEIKRKYHYCLKYYNYHTLGGLYFKSRSNLDNYIKEGKLKEAIWEYSNFIDLNSKLTGYETLDKQRLLYNDLDKYHQGLHFLLLKRIATTIKPSKFKLPAVHIEKPKKIKFKIETSLMRKHFGKELKKVYSAIKEGELKGANHLYYNLVEYYNTFVKYEYYEDQETTYIELRRLRDDLSAEFIKKKLRS